MEEHCPEPGLPACRDYVIVAQALSQVSQIILFRTNLLNSGHLRTMFKCHEFPNERETSITAKQQQTCISSQQAASSCTLLVFKQNFDPVCVVPVPFLHQPLVGTVTAVGRRHSRLRFVDFNGKLGEVITTIQLRPTI